MSDGGGAPPTVVPAGSFAAWATPKVAPRVRPLNLTGMRRRVLSAMMRTPGPRAHSARRSAAMQEAGLAAAALQRSATGRASTRSGSPHRPLTSRGAASGAIVSLSLSAEFPDVADIHRMMACVARRPTPRARTGGSLTVQRPTSRAETPAAETGRGATEPSFALSRLSRAREERAVASGAHPGLDFGRSTGKQAAALGAAVATATAAHDAAGRLASQLPPRDIVFGAVEALVRDNADLLRQGYLDLNAPTSTTLSTLLHTAVWFRRCRAIELLLRHGANPNAANLKVRAPRACLCATRSSEHAPAGQHPCPLRLRALCGWERARLRRAGAPTGCGGRPAVAHGPAHATRRVA